MKTVVLFILVFAFTRCNVGTAEVEGFIVRNELDTNKVIERQNCEYFYWYNNGDKNYTHKGNCKNPIHYKKIEIFYDTVYCSR